MVTVKETDCDASFVFHDFNQISIYTVRCFCLMVTCFGNAASFVNTIIVAPIFFGCNSGFCSYLTANLAYETVSLKF